MVGIPSRVVLGSFSTGTRARVRTRDKIQEVQHVTITAYTTKNGKRIRHDIDPTQVDSLDEISGDEQLALVWCETHKDWEWNRVERELLPRASA